MFFILLMSKNIYYVLDTSFILSGKNISINDGVMVTTQSVSDEISPGGKGYRYFQYLKEKGLDIYLPSVESNNIVQKAATTSGDLRRLSKTDIDVIALALDFKEKKEQVIILTDDYSIQNIANILNIKYQNITQKGIKKKFKWSYRCQGCGKYFKENINQCPICGSPIKQFIDKKSKL